MGPILRIDAALIPLAGLVALAVATVTFYRRHPPMTRRHGIETALWLAMPTALLLVLAAWSLLNARGVSRVALLGATAVLVASGAVVLLRLLRHRVNLGRHAMVDQRHGTKVAVRALRTVALLALCSATAFVALELPWNDALTSMAPNLIAVNVGILALLLAILYVLGQRTGVLVGVGVLVAGGFGLAQHFVVTFKGASILPSDLMALGTAAAVGGGYDYVLTNRIVIGLAVTGLGWALAARLCDPVRPERQAPRPGRAVMAAANVVVAAALLGCGSYALDTVDFVSLGLSNNYFSSTNIYKVQGFAASFAHLASTMKVDPPLGYATSGAEQLERDYAASYDAFRGQSPERTAARQQFDELRPSVIAVMNESFTDLSIFDGLGVGYAGPERFNAISDALLTGSVTPSNYGGGTCNSEFQFLTGFSSAYLGAAVFPYTAFDLTGMPSLAKQFSNLGYKTTAIHPNLATNWNRNVALDALGFDEFLTIDDFPDAPTYHAGVSDEATYDKILELLAQSDEPQFVFDITMQNHGGYQMGNVPAEDLPDATYPGVDDATAAQTNEFRACMEESDRAFFTFLEGLAELDRPVVVVLFGDHQPNFTRTLNDALMTDDSQLNHDARAYVTPYVIWANYDVAGNDQTSAEKDLGVHALGACLLDTIGAPLTDLQKAALDVTEDVNGLNALGWADLSGSWHAPDDPGTPQSVTDFEALQYLEMIDRPGK